MTMAARTTTKIAATFHFVMRIQDTTRKSSGREPRPTDRNGPRTPGARRAARPDGAFGSFDRLERRPLPPGLFPPPRTGPRPPGAGRAARPDGAFGSFDRLDRRPPPP